MQAAINTRARSRNAHTITTGPAAYVSAQHASVDTCTPPPLPKEQTLTRRPLGESLTRLLRDRGRGLDGGPSFGWNDQLSILLFASRILVSFSFPWLSIIHEKCRLRNMILRIRTTIRNSILSIFDLFVSRYDRIDPPSFLRWKLKFKRKEILFPCISRSESIRPVFRFLRGSLFSSRAGWLRSIEINSYEK